MKVFEFMNKGGIHLLDWKEYRSNTNKTAVQWFVYKFNFFYNRMKAWPLLAFSKLKQNYENTKTKSGLQNTEADILDKIENQLKENILFTFT